jgi:hypothetical protein
MSLHHLGLHRQFTSPTSKGFSEVAPSQELAQDSKDVLVDRLTDLVSRLSNTNFLKDNAITAIHSEVDKIELLIRRAEKIQRDSGLSRRMPTGDAILSREDDSLWGPMTPSHNIKMQLPNSPQRLKRIPSHTTELGNMPHSSQAEAVVKVAKAAEELAVTLARAVADLQLRRAESDHIHDLLVTKLEARAERILFLEYKIAEMEDDFEANQSELRFLRIQLKAIEAQCAEYIPRVEDPELSESIMNWRIAWEDIDRRSKNRRDKCHLTLTHSSGISKVVETA